MKAITSLTLSELVVLMQVARGWTSEQIAWRSDIKVEAVETRVVSAMRKLQLSTPTDLFGFVAAQGWRD
ncbi:MAG: LuxR C-terminal-related transcriptional regulator [Armatimonas sp.]